MRRIYLASVRRMIDDTLGDGGIEVGTDFLKELRDESKHIVGHDQPYYSLFYRLSEYLRPELVVELGSWRAFAAAHFAEPLSDTSRIITIDIHKDDQLAMLRTIMVSSELPNVTYLRKWTWNAGPDIEAISKELDAGIGILFMDAWHEYKYVKKEWEVFEPLLRDEALVIIDDVFDCEGATKDMVKFWDELQYDKFLDTRLHPPGIPMGFVHYKRI